MKKLSLQATEKRFIPRVSFTFMDAKAQVVELLENVLNLKGRASGFSMTTPLLGSVPELDSMAVVSVIAALEERFGFVIEDDDLDGATFGTVGSLVEFVQQKLGG